MQLPTKLSAFLNPKTDPNSPPEKTKKQKQLRLILLILVGLGFFLMMLALVLLLVNPSQNEVKKQTSDTDPEKALEKSKLEREEASQSAQEAAKPLNRLQSVFDEIVGSNSLKKELSFDEAGGKATINYVISSIDGVFIIKTSYENFADLATRVFNIPEVNKLSVSSFTTKFIDQYGQPNQVALTLEVDKETNSKINWPVKKYSYKDYATILNKHEINKQLNKDYEKLLKSL